jgi:drug/metabolite transporter (DMT)-like permease
MVLQASPRDHVGTARLLLLLLSLAWGLSWPVMRIALDEVTPLVMRLYAYGSGALFMFAVARLGGRSLNLPRGRAWAHTAASALLNVVSFGLLSAFAQLSTDTSRVVIVVYSMPVWASLLAWLLLRERVTLASATGLVLCAAGLAVLTRPAVGSGGLLGLTLALGCALAWAAGTVYLKWARIEGDAIAVIAWQLLASLIVIGLCLALFEGEPRFFPLKPSTALALAYIGVIGTGIAYFLWFAIVDRLPAVTASLGSLCTPVVGILSSVAVLGERPTLADMIGFVLILAAAACALIPAGAPTKKPGEP